MSDTRCHIAIAFTKAAETVRVSHRERSLILKESNKLEDLPQYFKTTKAESKKLQAFSQMFLRFYSERHENGSGKAINIISIIDGGYPHRLLHIDQAPAILFWRGRDLKGLSQRFVVTVIGSRNPSLYGLEVTKRLCGDLVKRGVTVVSGGARGVDGQAHSSALAGGGITYAVLGCGVDIAYPREHEQLFEEISESGAILSEYLPGTPPRRYHFPARNRILAGLCDAVIVTEASRSSGTLITAGFAADQGREVCAVPGSILTGTSRSCHDLIREGAVIMESIDDIPGMPAHPVQVERALKQDAVPTDEFSKTKQREQLALPLKSFATEKHPSLEKNESLILELLESSPKTLHAISSSCRISLRSTALYLATLQNKGLVRLHRGLYARSYSN